MVAMVCEIGYHVTDNHPQPPHITAHHPADGTISGGIGECVGSKQPNLDTPNEALEEIAEGEKKLLGHRWSRHRRL